MKTTFKSPLRHAQLGRLLFVLLLLLAGGRATAQTDVGRFGALSVKGNKIVSKTTGLPVRLAGNSLFWSNKGWGGEKYYKANVVGWLKNNWNASVVRVAMGVDDAGGYIEDPAREKAKVIAVVDACIAAGLYVIIDWHSHHAEDYKAQSIAFFKAMATKYGKTPNVMYEIYNEPKQVSWPNVVKPYAQDVADAIRTIDPDNLIIVGSPNWSQDVDVAAADKLTGTNIAYTLHFYAATHKQSLRDKAQKALDLNVALFVTEWGTCEASGNGAIDAASTKEWMDFMRTNQISHCNWALNDKAEAASALVTGTDPTAAWSNDFLTASGRLAKGYIQNWTPSSTATKVEAESYHVMSGVQTQATSDTGGGLNVGWLDPGDWMAYTVNVPTAGTYTIQYRVASPNTGGKLRLEQNAGTTQLATITVPNTGGWQNWTTITNTVTLNAGVQDIAISAPVGDYNINWWSFTKTTTAARTASTAELQLYPNPVQNQLQLTLAQPGSAASVQIINAYGKQVRTQQLSASTATDATIAVEGLEPGVYTLRLVEGDRITSTRFVKE
ncbi:cellulase family glycosylhydrolase [Hymenobacter glaciei]|uniref:cellulase family glycosylhydrolase n=1 Tax=Hymenobacter glaciei TaxID=877209 RepID=UPI0031E5B8F5